MTDNIIEQPIVAIASRVWWMTALRGAVAILVGVTMLVWPKESIGVAAVVFGVFVLIDGIVNIAGAFLDRDELGWGWTLTFGIIQTILGFLMIVWPIQSAAVWVLVIACWSLVAGAFATIGGIVDRDSLGGAWGWTVAWGIVTLLLGILMIGQPGIALIALLVVLGCYAIIIGILQLVAAFHIRKLAKAQLA